MRADLCSAVDVKGLEDVCSRDLLYLRISRFYVTC